jgi:urea transport system permease protein
VALAVLGAVLFSYAKTTFSEQLPSAWLYLQGGLFILVMTLAPKGLAGSFGTVREALAWRRLPAGRAAARTAVPADRVKEKEAV